MSPYLPSYHDRVLTKEIFWRNKDFYGGGGERKTDKKGKDRLKTLDNSPT